MGVLTGQPFEVQLAGDASLSRRPMDRVIEPLSKMGAFFASDANTLPLKIQEPAPFVHCLGRARSPARR